MAVIRYSNPARPSLGFLGGLLLSEEVPEGWWGSWVEQFALQSLHRWGHWEYDMFFPLFSLEKGRRENMKIVVPIINKQQTLKNE